MQTYPPNLVSPRRGQFWILGLARQKRLCSSRWSSLRLVSCELRRWICSRGNGTAVEAEMQSVWTSSQQSTGQVAAVRGMAAGSSCADRRRLRAEACTRPVIQTQLVWTSSQLQKSLLCILCEAKVRPPAAQVYRRRLGAGTYTNLKNRKSVARSHVVGGIAQSLHGQRAEAARSKTARWRHGHLTISAQPLHGGRTGSVRLSSGGCGDCTATPLRLHDFRTISAQPLYGFTLACPRGPVQEIPRCS